MAKKVKKLIINADDLGLSRSVNEAVKTCYLDGCITGTSVIPAGSEFVDAVRMLEDISKREVGVHLALTGGFSPVSRDLSLIGSLVGPDGKFPAGYLGVVSKYARGVLDLDEVYSEFSRQIDKVNTAGLTITHLDSHEHIHMLPSVLTVVMRLARENDIPYVRFPKEPLAVVRKHMSIHNLFRYNMLRLLSGALERNFDVGYPISNDHFLGHFHSGNIDDGVLGFMMDNLPDGLTELAVHPGANMEDLTEKSPWHVNAPRELEVLLGGNWRKKLKDGGIELVTHRDVATMI
ncbi:MAG: ChbG/HpnK family deacetylase [Candidatus Omnitrophica bacterium]|nr:ChbG/HpnK family deacetylase [Candidatus Omnitrophota bacterium]